MTTTSGGSLLEKCWIEVDQLLDALMTPAAGGVPHDKRSVAYQQPLGRLQGIAYVLSLFMAPHLITEKDVLAEAMRRHKARLAGDETYCTAGLAARRLEPPPTSTR